MAFVEVAANTLDDGVYEISNSLRCNGTDSYLTFTLGTPTSQRIATFSAWGKFNGQRAGSNDNSFWSFGDDYGQAMNVVRTAGTPQIYLDDSDGKNLSFNNGPNLRDTAAWYHFVVQIDTTQSTATNRMKWFINGTQLDNTTASHEASPDQNYDIPGLASGQVMGISARAGSAHFIDGYIAEMIYLDGSIAAPTNFGKVNDNGVWVPKKPSGLTFGNNGAWLEFKQTGTSANASGIGADTSGNGNHFAVNNLAAIDVCTDTPTNNFCTMNPLGMGGGTLAEGFLKETTDDNAGCPATFAVANGKWYWEIEITAGSNNHIGVADADYYSLLAASPNDYRITLYQPDGRVFNMGSTTQSGDSGRVYDTNDIMGIRLDLDSGTRTIKWYEDDTLIATENIGSAQVLLTPFSGKGGASNTCSYNFGNPSFTVSSGNADENGYGNFEYAVPSGHYALCTKNLAEYG